ncbi:PEP-CTERM sorting domain-containing protein [Aeoliella sp. ICT_H6.2]|uniref:PEP-CTERM sorting domain-containing protein n=1 Tax=Aeoliella straminimaris TaxID=2954799 RepID=A0A9X2JJ01_9BACT|nr:LamG-like jellyroll fold domain-containing protein [Aeoliella straminimaris]MCO6047082.1 PEP-CTERM sorting domain-containing protein [Aeoliella straminimaris]
MTIQDLRLSLPVATTTFLALLLVATSSSTAGTYSDAVLADNPLAYYRLNETSGTTAASSGSAAGVDATYEFIPGATSTNTSDYNQPGPDLPGFDATNRSIVLDPEEGGGDNPAVVRPWSASDPLAIDGSTGLTLEAWVKRAPQSIETSNDSEGIVGRYQDNTASPDGMEARSYLLVYDDEDNAFSFIITDLGNFSDADQLMASEYDVPLDEWLHVVGTYAPPALVNPGDPGMLTMYVNGEVVASKETTKTSIYTGQSDFWIGRQYTNSDQWTFEGNIDEVAVYDYPLSAEAVASHYAAAIPEPSTIAIAVLGAAAFGLRRRLLLDCDASRN